MFALFCEFVKICDMPKSTNASQSMPSSAAKALQDFAADLKLARQRRKVSLKEWAQRLDVSVPTLMRMEAGDPRVAVAVYVTALWMMNRHEALQALANPKEDVGALEIDIRTASRRHARDTVVQN